jgi:predicted membrane protein
MELHPHRDNLHGLRTHSGLVPGLILVAIGALFFLNNLHIIYVREWMAFWPVILIAIGIVKLVDSTSTGGKVAGGVLFGLGVIFLGQTFGYIQIQLRDLWPLALIGLGVLLLFNRVEHEFHLRLPEHIGAQSKRTSSANTLRMDAVFSGGKRVLTTQDFQGGDIVTIFGGVELDLRQAGMVADSAVLQINAIFGGVEVKIPGTWSADVEGMGIFGAFADNTLQPEPQISNVKRLIVKGGAVFGGVDVKN